MTDLVAIARSLFAPGKGLLAADESVATADKRLASYSIASGEEMRKKDRELFLNAPGVEEYLSGVILFSETFAQKGSDRKLFSNSLADRGVLPGIKVDEGTEPFPESPHELITKGLIGLPERLAEFAKKRAVFTKWRAVIKIEGDTLPTAQAILENAKRLATYAREAQEAGLVPILEPEVVLEGKHSRTRAADVLKEVLTTLFAQVDEQHVDRASIVLKTAMALSGSENTKKDTPEEVALNTVEALIASVPKQIAGIVFLSGGQTPDQATENLAAVCRRTKAVSAPWPVTFSFARALQEEALAVWRGEEVNLLAARAAFLSRLQKLSKAVYPDG
ncbi:MAG: class I fructose-bisphosphate aldolase [bacterium]|nr:class I fructose-bisphosphate aldolase [bacterium]